MLGWLSGPPNGGASSNTLLTISGGSVVVESETDGIDANGSINMTGGTVIVHGPTANHDGAIDYDGTFNLTGGTLIAAGSAGMAQVPSTSSTQPSVLITFPAALPAGTPVHIATTNGQDLLTFAPNKTFQTLVVSLPQLENGASYVVQTGGTMTGTATDGLYTAGTYTDGTQATTFTVAGIVTNAGATNVGRGPGMGRGGPPR